MARGSSAEHGSQTEMILHIRSHVLDDEEVESCGRHLRAELLGLDVESVDPIRATSPPLGARAGDPVTWTTLAITLTASGGILTTTIGALRDWLIRQRSVTAIDLTMDGDSIRIEGGINEDRERLISAFVARHKCT